MQVTKQKYFIPPNCNKAAQLSRYGTLYQTFDHVSPWETQSNTNITDLNNCSIDLTKLKRDNQRYSNKFKITCKNEKLNEINFEIISKTENYDNENSIYEKIQQKKILKERRNRQIFPSLQKQNLKKKSTKNLISQKLNKNIQKHTIKSVCYNYLQVGQQNQKWDNFTVNIKNHQYKPEKLLKKKTIKEEYERQKMLKKLKDQLPKDLFLFKQNLMNLIN